MAGEYTKRAASGHLKVRVSREGHPSPAASGQPYCTRSQILRYFDEDGQRVAVAHQYLRPDGSIGGSGLPDPKAILQDGVLYFLRIGDPGPGQ